jgi:hypothetical protein
MIAKAQRKSVQALPKTIPSLSHTCFFSTVIAKDVIWK